MSTHILSNDNYDPNITPPEGNDQKMLYPDDIMTAVR
jgi:hypothetical protein